MLHGFVVLVLFQFAGEAAARFGGLPAPGPVIGLAALVAVALVSQRVRTLVEPVADALLRHLSLLFVPAGVGVLQHWPLIQVRFAPLTLVLIASTAVTLAVTAVVFAALARRADARETAR